MQMNLHSTTSLRATPETFYDFASTFSFRFSITLVRHFVTNHFCIEHSSTAESTAVACPTFHHGFGKIPHKTRAHGAYPVRNGPNCLVLGFVIRKFPKHEHANLKFKLSFIASVSFAFVDCTENLCCTVVRYFSLPLTMRYFASDFKG